MPKYREEHITLDKEKLKVFAKRAKELRTESELSQKDLGNYLGGFSPSTIGGYESATRSPDLSTLIAYSKFFDVSVDYLIGDTNVRKTLYRVAASTDITQKNVGKLSQKAMEEIDQFVQYVLMKESQAKGKNNKKK